MNRAITHNMKQRPCKTCGGSGQILDRKSVGKEMAKLRKSSGVSRTDLANLLGIPNSTLASWEAGRRGQWTTEFVATFQAGVAKLAR